MTGINPPVHTSECGGTGLRAPGQQACPMAAFCFPSPEWGCCLHIACGILAVNSTQRWKPAFSSLVEVFVCAHLVGPSGLPQGSEAGGARYLVRSWIRQVTCLTEGDQPLRDKVETGSQEIWVLGLVLPWLNEFGQAPFPPAPEFPHM